MRKILEDICGDLGFWIDLSCFFAIATVLIYLNLSWQVTLVYFVISGVVVLVISWKKKREVRAINKLEKEYRQILKEAKKQGEITVAYRAIEDKLLPALRKELPKKIYKYYYLGGNGNSDKKRLDTLKNDSIWASIPSLFNDPFEGRFMYIEDDEWSVLGFPSGAENLWDLVMGQIREHITTICFTQNPNDMPMWAHYANEHKGFCVEYEILNTEHLYPVLYAENRLNAQALFVELIYWLFCTESAQNNVRVLFKHIMLLSTFKDKSWESEKEIRAVFLNTKDEIGNRGKNYSCREIGVRATKIYIGVQCNEENTSCLIDIANDIGIEYELCQLSTGKTVRVTKE